MKTLTPFFCVYDEARLAQAGSIASSRAASGKSVLFTVLNPNSGPGTNPPEDWQKKWVNWKPAGVMRVGYVDIDDEQGNPRSADDIKADILIWKNLYKVPFIFLDDCHFFGNVAKDNAMRTRVQTALNGTGYANTSVWLNAGDNIPPSSWMRVGGYNVCDFEDPTNNLNSQNTGGTWIGFVRDQKDASTMLNAAQNRSVKYLSFESLDTWHVAGGEFQKPLPEWLVQLYKTF